jgi:hypothetical protein
MITIVYSTHKDETYNNKFRQHLLQTVGLKNVQILEYVNHNQFSLTELYNRGIQESINNIIVCVHNDVKIENNWGKKLLKDFSENPDFAIIGKAGSCYFPESGVYWDRMSQTMVGQVYHHPNGQNKWLSKYSPKLPFLIPVVTIDGVFLSFDKTKIKHNFDETIGKFHYYDHPFCLSNYLDGVKLGITSSFELTHQSVGQPNQEFFDSKEIFLKKYGEVLPLDLKPTQPYNINQKQNTIKNIGKTAILIGYNEYDTFNEEVINSIYNNCDEKLFDIILFTYNNLNELSTTPQKSNLIVVNSDKPYLSSAYNDVIKNKLSNEYSFLFFVKNNTIILNDVIYGMVKNFKTNSKIGTLSSRIHYHDNTIKSCGVEVANQPQPVLKYSQNYYNYPIYLEEVNCNQFNLTMVRTNVFLSQGMFNENSISGYEDIEFCIKIRDKYKNYVDTSLVGKELSTEDKPKIKIITGFSDKGGSTFAFINLTNQLNDAGIDCTLYGPHKWHLNKCKSDLLINFRFEPNDNIISHFLNLETRPDVKRIILSCHEKDLFKVWEVKQHWDEVVFINETHREYHNQYKGNYSIIPNLTQNLFKSDKSGVEKIAGIIGSFDFNKQTHISIQRALNDGCEKVYLFGEPNTDYFNQYVKPLCSDKVIVKGFMDDKQKMYDMIGKVYSSSLSEVASLVKDECILTGTEFIGTNSTSHKNIYWGNETIINEWKKIFNL